MGRLPSQVAEQLLRADPAAAAAAVASCQQPSGPAGVPADVGGGASSEAVLHSSGVSRARIQLLRAGGGTAEDLMAAGTGLQQQQKIHVFACSCVPLAVCSPSRPR